MSFETFLNPHLTLSPDGYPMLGAGMFPIVLAKEVSTGGPTSDVSTKAAPLDIYVPPAPAHHSRADNTLARALKIEAQLGDADYNVRQSAIEALNQITPHLKEDDLWKLALKIEARLGDVYDFFRYKFIGTLAQITPHLKKKDRLKLALKIEARLGDVSKYFCSSVIETLGHIIPFLKEDDQLARTLKLEEQLGDVDGDFRYKVKKTLIQITPYLKEDDRLKLALKIEVRLDDQNKKVRNSAITALCEIIPCLSLADKIQVISRLWKRNLLFSIEFEDGGNGVSYWYQLAQAVLPEEAFPAVEIPNTRDIQKVLLPADFDSGTITLGRSTVKDMEDGALLVFKALKAGQSKGDLLRELAWATRVTNSGLRSAVIESLGQVNKKGKKGILFKAPKNYYQYLTDEGVTWDVFKKGLFDAIHDTFLLASKGLYHMVPIRLFHNAEPGHLNRNSGDRGRYTWMPDLVFGYTTRPGMGRLDNWNGALQYGNYGVSGLRDLEELATMDEVIKHGEKWAPELRGLADKPKSKELYYMAILGNHLLAGVLYIGHYLRKAAQADNEHTFWKDDQKLKPYAETLYEMFSLAHGVKYGLSEEVAKETMKDKADWLKLARQMAFYMTKAYVHYVKPGADIEEFPQEIYGPETQIEITGNIYRDNSFEADGNGWIGPSGEPDQLSLGPVNGQFPIREFEAAAYGTFLPWNAMAAAPAMMGMR